MIAFPNVDDGIRESRIAQRQNPKTPESVVQHPAFLQKRILYQDQFCLFLLPIRISSRTRTAFCSTTTTLLQRPRTEDTGLRRTYNHVHYDESINNLPPADVYFGRTEALLAERNRIKRNTTANRGVQHQLQAA